MKYLYYLIAIITFSACNKYTDDKIFNGKIKMMRDLSVTKEIEFKEIAFNENNYGFFSVYDTLALFMNPKLNTHIYNAFCLRSHEEIGRYFKKGLGPNEYLSLSPIFDFYNQNHELKALLYNANDEEAYIWNITRTIKEDSTIIDNKIWLPWRKDNNGACYSNLFMKNNNTLFAKVSSTPISNNEATLPYYQIWELADSIKKIEDLQIYKTTIRNNQTQVLPETFLYSHDAMKPDGKKIAQALLHIPQLNIIDTNTKQITGFRIGNNTDFSTIGNKKTLNSYFVRIHVDDEFIYTLFWGKDNWEVNTIPTIDQMYIFDWEGNLRYKIKAKHSISDIYVDNINRILYTTSIDSDNIYYTELDNLIEIN